MFCCDASRCPVAAMTALPELSCSCICHSFTAHLRNCFFKQHSHSDLQIVHSLLAPQSLVFLTQPTSALGLCRNSSSHQPVCHPQCGAVPPLALAPFLQRLALPIMATPKAWARSLSQAGNSSIRFASCCAAFRDDLGPEHTALDSQKKKSAMQAAIS